MYSKYSIAPYFRTQGGSTDLTDNGQMLEAGGRKSRHQLVYLPGSVSEETVVYETFVVMGELGKGLSA